MQEQRRFLVVDDQPEIGRLVEAAYSTEPDVAIDTALTAGQAWERFSVVPYDLMLVDVRLPDGDGLELVKRCRAVKPGMKVVVMTGDSGPAATVESVRGKAQGFLSKPFTVPEMKAALTAALESPGASDDIELISATENWIAFRVRCRLAVADRLLHVIRGIEADVPPVQLEEIATAFREILLNAIEHGGGGNPQKKVYVACVRARHSLIYYVRDPGRGFSLEGLSHAAISNAPGEVIGHAEIRQKQGLRPGGFGILMASNLVDELLYNQKGNEVILIKYLKPGGEAG